MALYSSTWHHANTHHHGNMCYHGLVLLSLLIYLVAITMVTGLGYRQRLMWSTDGYIGRGAALRAPYAASKIRCSVECLDHPECAAYNSYTELGDGGQMVVMCDMRALNDAPLLAQTGAVYTYDKYFGMSFDVVLGTWYSNTAEVRANYSDAEAICQSRGLHVMAIRSQAEQDKLAAIRPSTNTWLGMHRPVGGTANDIRYTKDGLPIGYWNFKGVQPDQSPPGADCVMSYFSQGHQWFDAPCTITPTFVCQS